MGVTRGAMIADSLAPLTSVLWGERVGSETLSPLPCPALRDSARLLSIEPVSPIFPDLMMPPKHAQRGLCPFAWQVHGVRRLP